MDVGYCEHPACPDPDDVPGGPNATNRRGDRFLCDDHVADEEVSDLLDRLWEVTNKGNAKDVVAALHELLAENGR